MKCDTHSHADCLFDPKLSYNDILFYTLYNVNYTTMESQFLDPPWEFSIDESLED